MLLIDQINTVENKESFKQKNSFTKTPEVINRKKQQMLIKTQNYQQLINTACLKNYGDFLILLVISCICM